MQIPIARIPEGVGFAAAALLTLHQHLARSWAARSSGGAVFGDACRCSFESFDELFESLLVVEANL